MKYFCLGWKCQGTAHKKTGFWDQKCRAHCCGGEADPAVCKECDQDIQYIHHKAAREGIGGGPGPIFGGVRPSYLVQDDTGVQMPNYVGSRSQDVKELNETCDIQQSKKRLGFTW